MKKTLSILLSILMVLSALAIMPFYAFAEETIQISNYNQLKAFATRVNSGETNLNAELTADITAEDKKWVPIGDDFAHGFTGTFNGNLHTITGLSNQDVEAAPTFAGLFGVIDENGEVKNTIVNGVDMKTREGSSYIGAVVGYNTRGKITNCANTGDITGYSEDIGGIAGYNNNGTISNCYNTGNITGETTDIYVGGITSTNQSGEIVNCFNTGKVKGTATDSYGRACVGGICGLNYGQPKSLVHNCYSAGEIEGSASGSNYIGALIGKNTSNNGGAIENSYYNSDIVTAYGATGEGDIGENVKGLTTAEMTAGTYTDDGKVTNMPGFSSDDWLVRESDEIFSYYPHLRGFDLDDSGAQIPAEDIRKTDWPARLLKDGVCEISDYAELKEFASRVNNLEPGLCAVLTANIDASASDPEKNPNYNADTDAWTPIGNSYYYVGTFDGDGHKIIGLTTPGDYKGTAGLFDGVDTLGTVQNVGLEGGKLNGTDYAVGGVVGHNIGTVQNCYSTGSIIGNNTYTGGVIGYNEGGTVQKCYNTGSVESNSAYTGGVIGYNDGTVQNCYNTGSVKGTGLYTGGVIGYNEGTVQNCCNTGSVESNNSFTGGVFGILEDGEAQNCFNTGNVSGKGYVGGVAGFLQDGTVSDCYNTGRVTSSDTYVGGVAGLIEDSTVSDCYNTGSVKGNGMFVGGVAGLVSDEVENCYYDKSICNVDNDIGTGLTTDNMTGANALNNMSGFSSAAWLTKANTDDIKFYPHLKGFNLDNSGSQLSAENIQPEDWPAKCVIYPLWVGGNQVTTGNMGALEDLDGVTVAEGGSVTFEPNKDGTGGTLYLNNATITGTYEFNSSGPYYANICVENTAFDLTINLSGENIISSTDHGIHLLNLDKPAVLTIEGKGTLDITTVLASILCFGSLTVDGTTVNATATGKDGYASQGICSLNTYITGSTVTAKSYGPNGEGISCDGLLNIDGSTVEATGSNVGISVRDSLTVSGVSIVTANGDSEYSGLGVYGGFVFNDGNDILTPEEYTVSDNDVGKIITDKDGNTAETVVIGQPCAVTFNNDDGTELQSGKILKGTVPEYKGETPTKTDPTGQYTYTFSGWKDSAGNTYGTKPEFPKADVATIYTATFTNTVNEYTIKFANEDCTELQSGKVLYGETPEYKGNTPTKAATAEYTYTFAGWTPEIASVTGDATYTATYTATLVDYTLTFCVDGKVYKESTVPFGSEVKAPEAETKEGYTFTWVDDIPATMPAKDITINGKYTPIEYTATFTADGKTVAEVPFTVETKKLDEPAVPAKEGYTGKWSEYTLGAADITITSEYTANEYTITYVVDGKKTEVKYAFGAAVSKPANPSKEGFTFDGWDKDIPATMPAENLTITALFSPVPATEVSEIEFTDSFEILEKTRLYGLDNGFSVKGDIPKGAKVEWYVNGEKAGEGRNFIVTEPKADYTVQAKLVDAQGNVLSETDEANIDINTGLFARLYWFFCSLVQRVIDIFKGTAA